MGYLDKDENIFLIERKQFYISYRGKIINQSEIERLILDNVEKVSAVCFVDVESDKRGAMPYIAIIPDHGVTLSEEEIVKAVMKYYPFEFETRIFFFEKLPMTTAGKFKKHLVRSMIMSQMMNA